MKNPILGFVVAFLFIFIPCLVYASGTEIKGKVATQNETENDYMNKLYVGFIDINLHFPDKMDENTGLMTLLHGWGGEYHQYDSYADDWRNRYNVICLQVQYRDSGTWTVPYDFGKYQAIDVLRSIQYVRENYKVNDERIIAWGGSGGGNIVLQTGKMAPNTFALIVDCSGITRPTNNADVMGAYKNDASASYGLGGWESAALGTGNHYTLPEWQIRSSQYHGAFFNAPVHILHGNKDTTVHYQHAVDMYNALIAAGKEAFLHTIANGSHSFSGANSSENDRKKATEKYVSDDILNRRTDGNTDFEMESKVELPTETGYTYIIDYKDAAPKLSVVEPVAVDKTGKLKSNWSEIKKND